MKNFKCFIGMTVTSLFLANVCTGATYITLPSGYIQRAFIDYVDPNTIKIHAGFGECSGNYWEITSPIEHDMTGLTTTQDFHYIYIDDANSIYPAPTIIDRTTEPIWSDLKMGWYDGHDRCIGVVASKSGSPALFAFAGHTDSKIIVTDDSSIYLLENGDPTGNWIFLDSSAFIPVNAKSMLLHCSNYSSTLSSLRVSVYGFNRRHEIMAQAYGNSAGIQGWLELPQGASRDLEWWNVDSASSNFSIRLVGWSVAR